MNTKRTLAILLFLVALITFSVGVTLALQTPSSLSTLAAPTHTPVIMLTSSTATQTLTPAPAFNITWEQYQAALSRWRSRSIDEYEMEFSLSAYSYYAGSYTFRVTKDGIELLDYRPLYPNPDAGDPNPRSKLSKEAWQRTLERYTIESQFEHFYDAYNADIYCLATFDPKYGFPSVVECKNRPGVSDAQSTRRLKLLKVLKSHGSPIPQPTPTPLAHQPNIKPIK